MKPEQRHYKQKWAKTACAYAASSSGRSLNIPSAEVMGRHGKGFLSAIGEQHLINSCDPGKQHPVVSLESNRFVYG